MGHRSLEEAINKLRNLIKTDISERNYFYRKERNTCSGRCNQNRLPNLFPNKANRCFQNRRPTVKGRPNPKSWRNQLQYSVSFSNSLPFISGTISSPSKGKRNRQIIKVGVDRRVKTR